jgi:hypothetical protein
LVACGYVTPGKRDDRKAIGEAIAVLLDLMSTH